MELVIYVLASLVVVSLLIRFYEGRAKEDSYTSTNPTFPANPEEGDLHLRAGKIYKYQIELMDDGTTVGAWIYVRTISFKDMPK